MADSPRRRRRLLLSDHTAKHRIRECSIETHASPDLLAHGKQIDYWPLCVHADAGLRSFEAQLAEGI